MDGQSLSKFIRPCAKAPAADFRDNQWLPYGPNMLGILSRAKPPIASRSRKESSEHVQNPGLAGAGSALIYCLNSVSITTTDVRHTSWFSPFCFWSGHTLKSKRLDSCSRVTSSFPPRLCLCTLEPPTASCLLHVSGLDFHRCAQL